MCEGYIGATGPIGWPGPRGDEITVSEKEYPHGWEKNSHAGYPEDGERISIVLDIQGNETQRREVRRMLEEALETVRTSGAEVRGSVMVKNAQGVRCVLVSSGK